ncbi:hypothetical protein [uncultured Bradyrhizobium sp.]|jgi:hypothetical protein|uniref:hypothetical protein n=1 Tax=uncultured Bradyrhizobium sp. TaxID=199684 RepID=UPI00260455ED|nr:hypothetical protein [uncultured Bradyrhizobium sp.]
MRTLIAVTFVGVLGAGVFDSGPTRAENLNLKFGPTWSCKMISAELNDLYESCRRCEKRTPPEHFNQLSPTEGECVPKGSLKGNRYEDAPSDIAREREIQQQIDDLVKERETLTLKRMQEKKWRDSGVSGSSSGASRAPESRRNEDEGATPNGWAGKSITIERKADYRNESKDGVVTKTIVPPPLNLTIAKDGSIIPSHGSLVGDDQPIVIGRSNHTLPSGDATITAELSYPDGALVLVLETHEKYTVQDVSKMELKRISRDECTFRDLSTIVYKRSRERVTINHTSTRCVIR